MRPVALVIKTALQAHSHLRLSPHHLLQSLHTPEIVVTYYQPQNSFHTIQPVTMPTYIVRIKLAYDVVSGTHRVDVMLS